MNHDRSDWMRTDFDEMARRYLAYYDMQRRGAPDRDRFFDDWEAVHHVIAAGSKEASFDLLKCLVDQAKDDTALHFIAAGPLEDYLCKHGTAVVADVLAYSNRVPRFARALEGVWGMSAMSRDARTQLEAWFERRRVS